MKPEKVFRHMKFGTILASALAVTALVSAAYAQDTPPECEVCVKVMGDVKKAASEVAAKVGKKAHSKKVLFSAIEKVCEKNKKIGECLSPCVAGAAGRLGYGRLWPWWSPSRSGGRGCRIVEPLCVLLVLCRVSLSFGGWG